MEALEAAAATFQFELLPELEAAVLSIGAALELAELACGSIDPADYHVDFMDSYVRPTAADQYAAEANVITFDPSGAQNVVASRYDSSDGTLDIVTIYPDDASQHALSSLTTTRDRDCTLVMCGGGGGGGYNGGGGGGAGVFSEARLRLPAGTYNFVIGAGGAPGTDQASNEAGENGGDTQMMFASNGGNILYVYGGGGGNGVATQGSTGGGDKYTTDSGVYSVTGSSHIDHITTRSDNLFNLGYDQDTTPTLDVAQRYTGGTGIYTTRVTDAFGGGGGGCASAGQNGSSSIQVGGSGGDGVLKYLYYFCYGGNGGSQSLNEATNTYGGSGASRDTSAGVPSAFGSGGGGGAGHLQDMNPGGSAGSSGMVMIRFDK